MFKRGKMAALPAPANSLPILHVICSLLIFDLATAFFPVSITGIDTNVQLSVPYSFILPTFRRRRRSTSESVLEPKSRQGMAWWRLTSLFSGMGMEEVDCHKRLLCLVSQNPHKYSPLTEIVFQHLDPRLDENLTVTNETSPEYSMFHQLYQAGRMGFYPGTDCNFSFSSCTANPDAFIDWNKMKFYHLVKRFADINFK